MLVGSAMHPRILVSLITASLALGACTGDNGDNGPAILIVQNRSDHAIVDIRIARTADPSFGANLLGAETLAPGMEVTLGVSCGVFDARVLDDAGAECDLSAVDLCADNALWVITDQTCAVFGARGRARGGQETP